MSRFILVHLSKSEAFPTNLNDNLKTVLTFIWQEEIIYLVNDFDLDKVLFRRSWRWIQLTLVNQWHRGSMTRLHFLPLPKKLKAEFLGYGRRHLVLVSTFGVILFLLQLIRRTVSRGVIRTSNSALCWRQEIRHKYFSWLRASWASHSRGSLSSQTEASVKMKNILV